LEEYSRQWNSEFQRKLERWKNLTPEQRYKAIIKLLSYFEAKAKESPLVAGIEFYAWLSSPDGAIVWPAIFRPEFRSVIVDITKYLLMIIHRERAKGQIEAAMMAGGAR